MALMNIPMLEHYAKQGKNVLFEGHRGVGKTATIDGVFTGLGLNWKYFSTPTMDPWVDLVGVPKVREREGLKPVAELIRPSYIEDDVYEAIFFDELNRADPKTLNAVMELIQFRSINGHKLKNLKCIWGAINPYDADGTYQVEELDPALIDRFHCYIKFPYKLDEAFLRGKYPSVATYFIDWWNDLPVDAQLRVSPRRLEYLIEGHLDGSRMEDIVASEGKINIKQLRDSIRTIPFKQLLIETADADAAAIVLKDGNNVTKLLDLVKKKDAAATEFFTKFRGQLSEEIIQPFVDAVSASKSKKGPEVTIKSFEHLIDQIPEKNVDAGTGTMINNLDIRHLYVNGHTMQKDVQTLINARPNRLRFLANRLCDIIMHCQQKTVDKLIWGQACPTALTVTNFQQIMNCLMPHAATSNIWTPRQLPYIQTKINAAMRHGDQSPQAKPLAEAA